MVPTRSGLAVRVGVLGPLSLHVQGHEVEVKGARRRALLAMLALTSGRTVSAERLVTALWPDVAPEHATQALYSHVSRLRGQLGPLAERLRREGRGYRLVLEQDELDVGAVHRLVREVEATPADPEATVAAAREALGLWRGGALEEFAGFPELEVQSVGLAELRLELVDVLLEARLALGERSLVVDAAAAAAASPLRERTTRLLVRALATEGRSAEAMATAQEFRRRLVDETGLDPGPALAELEQLVAAGDAALTSAQAVPTATVRRPYAPVRPDGPIVGRRHDREELLRLLRRHGVVTLTGPGGVGKTTLALDVAADPEAASGREVAVVDLAAVERAERVCESVASTLGLSVTDGATADQVARALAGRSLLLVLDNCEHVIGPCRVLVGAVRARAAGVQVFATSRTTLQVSGEYVMRLQPFPVPREVQEADRLRRQPGVRAFVEHARRRRPGFDLEDADADAVLDVLRRLDGLPLGIELAARQVALMPLAEVRRRLDRALDLATGRQGPTYDRQRTLRATIGSSFQLLDQAGRDLLLALAAFPGAVELPTVEALARDVAPGADPLDLLHHVVDASLLVADAATGHVRLLFTVRSFLLDELARSDALQPAEQRFLDRALTTARELGRLGAGPGERAADARLRGQLDNFRAARDVALRHGRTDVLVGITLALADLATWRDLRELWTWALELAEDPALAAHPDRAAILGCAAEAARLVGDFARASWLADEAFAAAEGLQGTGEEGPGDRDVVLRWAWAARGAVAHFRGEFDVARDSWVRASRGGDGVAGALLASAALASAYGGDGGLARRMLDEAHRANREHGVPSGTALAAYVEGELVANDDPAAAVHWYLDAIETAQRCGARYFEGVARVAMASVRTRLDDLTGAAEEFRGLLDVWTRSGHTTQLWTTARNAAQLLLGTGRRHAAAMLLVCADDQPAAAAVSPAIARHSGRAFVPLEDVVSPDQLQELRAEVALLGSHGVLERARGELEALSRSGRQGR
jgi:predicted ATPase/DNA-binding SARP family transcriptional activator